MGSLNKKVNLFNCGSFKSGLVAGKEGRAGLFNVIATVYTLQLCQVLGRSRSLTWEIDCSELELCAASC